MVQLTLNALERSRPDHIYRFDIEGFDFAIEDEPGMLRSVRSINELVAAEVDAGIPADRIIVGGFSQGGVMSLLTGLTSERKLGGVVVMSSWLPLKAKFKAVSTNALPQAMYLYLKASPDGE